MEIDGGRLKRKLLDWMVLLTGNIRQYHNETFTAACNNIF